MILIALAKLLRA